MKRRMSPRGNISTSEVVLNDWKKNLLVTSFQPMREIIRLKLTFQ